MAGKMIVEFDDSVRGLKPNGRLPPGGAAGFFDRRESAAASARVNRGSILGVRRAGGQFGFAPRADARICEFGGQKFIDSSAINRLAFRLIDRAFVPIEAEPVQILNGLTISPGFA